MGNNRIKIGHLIASSMEDNHFSQDRFRGHMQLNNSDPYRIHIRDKQAPPLQQQQQQQRVPTQGNSPSLEDLMNNLEFQQSVSSSNMQFQQNMTATIQDLKTQIGQLANTQPPLSNHNKSERKRQCSHSSNSCRDQLKPTLSQGRLAVLARDSCPIAISISDHLGKEAIVK
ncbi:hypothetical protein CR513_31936, partial [Mucuna pruriens]